jgi:hypothetical protein
MGERKPRRRLPPDRRDCFDPAAAWRGTTALAKSRSWRSLMRGYSFATVPIAAPTA